MKYVIADLRFCCHSMTRKGSFGDGNQFGVHVHTFCPALLLVPY